jgi:CRP/FNR family cyclic AMP-dependent transcriptional regulator
MRRMAADSLFLSDVLLFSTLDPDERDLLAGAVSSRTLEPAETLFRTGEPGDAMFIVRQGAVELFVKDTTGQKILLHTARAGDFFGELSLFDGGPRTATAAAVEPSELIVLDRQDLLQLFQKHPDAALHMLANLSTMTRKADALLRQRVARNVNEEIQVKSTMVQRIADVIAAFSGSMSFLFLNVGWFLIWISWNTLPGFNHFDPFPFGLLTMIVSLEAIFLSCFVLISQDRQAAKDRVRADIEYEVNIKAELGVAHLHEKTDRIYEEMLDRFARVEKTLARSGK